MSSLLSRSLLSLSHRPFLSLAGARLRLAPMLSSRDYSVNGNEVKTGAMIVWEGKTYIVQGTSVNMKGRAHTTYNLDLKDVASVSKISIKVRPADKIEVIHLETDKLQFLYVSGNILHFMHPETFEQIEISKNVVGDKVDFLIENTPYSLRRNGSTYLSLLLPEKVVCTIASTGSKSSTVNDAYKSAVLTNGRSVQVPGFIEAGAHVIINTTTNEYVGRSDTPPQ